MLDEASCAEEATFEGDDSRGSLEYCSDFSRPLAGHWVVDADPSKRQSFLTCPLIASQYGCAFMGLPHGEVAARMRWAPHGCRLRPYCGATLAALLRGRRVITIGDSHGRQLYSSLACKLYASGHVGGISGPCRDDEYHPRTKSANYPSATMACLPHGQYPNNRVLCGPKRCTGGPTAPYEAMRSGPEHGTVVRLRGDDRGALIYEEPVAPMAPTGGDVRKWAETFYERSFAMLNATWQLEARDVVIVNDIGAARHASEREVLRLLAASFVRASRGVPFHVVWADAMAPHFAGAADGEYMHRNRHGELNREEVRRSCGGEEQGHAPRPFRSDLDGGTKCRPHTCNAKGASNLPMLGPIGAAQLPIVHSFHASRLAHIAHSGIAMVNYSAWKMPDCHHVCQPSGPDELRVSLVYNMLVSGWIFASTRWRGQH